MLLLLVLGFMLACMLTPEGTVAGGILMVLDVLAASCRGFSSLPGPLQTVQRAELWVVILALQASNAVHPGVGNLNVVRHVGRLLDGVRAPCPLELEDDGDLTGLIWKTLYARREGTACISNVKGHADEELVRRGQVRELDRDGSNRADEAADFGRRGFGLMSLMLGATFLGMYFLSWMQRETRSRKDRTTQRGRYSHYLRVLVRACTGRAQLSGHKLGSGAGHCSLDCGGLSRI